ncbi:MAG: hypothetical protein K2N36_06825, partial [Ruminiclostridium sp.]|nr:hypothetical protein [Ruminiclostridium sp.]
ITEGVLYADEPWSSVGQNGRAIIGGDMAKISKLFLIDLNGDSNNEICAEVHWDYGSGVSGSCIYILDYAQKQYYTVSGEVGKTEYYLGERDGDLIAFKTQFRSDGDRGQTLSDEKLALDMADCFAHINMRGHSAYCIQDSLYCGQQEGECPYTGNHHEEASGEHHEEEPDEHHGHSEYCLQNADYCAQQDGKCPYRPDDLEDMPIVIQGHNEHCLEDADYCSQQEGECPYTGGHHNEEPEHHGHSEYCLQDANYCSQQEGECPYKQSGHHGEDHSSEHGGHH